jgi:hypothetical protein
MISKLKWFGSKKAGSSSKTRWGCYHSRRGLFSVEKVVAKAALAGIMVIPSGAAFGFKGR